MFCPLLKSSLKVQSVCMPIPKVVDYERRSLSKGLIITLTFSCVRTPESRDGHDSDVIR